MTMQELAKQNIEDEFERLTKRAKHRKEQFNNKEIDSDDMFDLINGYYSELKGFLRAYWLMGALTDEEHHNLKDKAVGILRIMHE